MVLDIGSWLGTWPITVNLKTLLGTVGTYFSADYV